MATPSRGGTVSRLARWLLWGLVFLLPLAVWRGIYSTISVHVLIKSVILGLVGGAILILAGLALAMDGDAYRQARRWVGSAPAWGFLALAAAVAAATAVSPERDYAWSEAWVYFVPLGLGASCGWILRSPLHARRTAWLMVAAGVTVALLGLLDTAGIIPLFKWTTGTTFEELLAQGGPDMLLKVQGGTTRGRMLSTLGNPAYVGGFLVIPTVLLGCWLIAGWEGERPGWKRAIWGWGALGVLGVALVATSTREAWLGVLVGVAARVWLTNRTPRARMEGEPTRRGLSKRAWVALAGMAAGLIVLLIVFSTPNPINRQGWKVAGRFVELANPRSDSVKERLMFYTLAGRMATERPVLGWGPGMYGVRFFPTIEQFQNEGPYGPWAVLVEEIRGRVAASTHNDFLQIMVECGVVGLGALLWLIASTGVLAASRARRPDRWGFPVGTGTLRVLASAWFAGLSTMTSFPLHTPARSLYFWTLTGMVTTLLVLPSDAAPGDGSPAAGSAKVERRAAPGS